MKILKKNENFSQAVEYLDLKSFIKDKLDDDNLSNILQSILNHIEDKTLKKIIDNYKENGIVESSSETSSTDDERSYEESNDKSEKVVPYYTDLVQKPITEKQKGRA